MEVLRTINLSKSYGSGDTRVEALKNINLSIRRGEFVAVVGSSGSGKSTLLHLLGGVDRPSSGQVIIGGTDIYSLSEEERAVFRRRQVGFIFQFYNLVPVLNAEENMILPMLLDGKKGDMEHIRELLRVLGLQERRRHLPAELSGGQQQRVAIGRAMCCKPSIILADEPTGNLDSRNSKDIVDLLRLSVSHYRQTLVMITHDVNIASQADRIITIEDGMVTRDEAVLS